MGAVDHALIKYSCCSSPRSPNRLCWAQLCRRSQPKCGFRILFLIEMNIFCQCIRLDPSQVDFMRTFSDISLTTLLREASLGRGWLQPTERVSGLSDFPVPASFCAQRSVEDEHDEVVASVVRILNHIDILCWYTWFCSFADYRID
jgi:hypothetical protein